MASATLPYPCTVTVFKDSGKPGVSVDLHPERSWFTFGNHEDCDVRIHAPGIASLHAMIEVKPDKVLLHGLDYIYPVFISRTKKSIRRQEFVSLSNNDHFMLGKRKFGVSFDSPIHNILNASDDPSSTSVETASPTASEPTSEDAHPDIDSPQPKPAQSSKPARKRRTSLVVTASDETFVSNMADPSRLLQRLPLPPNPHDKPSNLNKPARKNISRRAADSSDADPIAPITPKKSSTPAPMTAQPRVRKTPSASRATPARVTRSRSRDAESPRALKKVPFEADDEDKKKDAASKPSAGRLAAATPATPATSRTATPGRMLTRSAAKANLSLPPPDLDLPNSQPLLESLSASERRELVYSRLCSGLPATPLRGLGTASKSKSRLPAPGTSSELQVEKSDDSGNDSRDQVPSLHNLGESNSQDTNSTNDELPVSIEKDEASASTEKDVEYPEADIDHLANSMNDVSLQYNSSLNSIPSGERDLKFEDIDPETSDEPVANKETKAELPQDGSEDIHGQDGQDSCGPSDHSEETPSGDAMVHKAEGMEVEDFRDDADELTIQPPVDHSGSNDHLKGTSSQEDAVHVEGEEDETIERQESYDSETIKAHTPGLEMHSGDTVRSKDDEGAMKGVGVGTANESIEDDLQKNSDIRTDDAAFSEHVALDSSIEPKDEDREECATEKDNDPNQQTCAEQKSEASNPDRTSSVNLLVAKFEDKRLSGSVRPLILPMPKALQSGVDSTSLPKVSIQVTELESQMKRVRLSEMSKSDDNSHVDNAVDSSNRNDGTGITGLVEVTREWESENLPPEGKGESVEPASGVSTVTVDSKTLAKMTQSTLERADLPSMNDKTVILGADDKSADEDHPPRIPNESNESVDASGCVVIDRDYIGDSSKGISLSERTGQYVTVPFVVEDIAQSHSEQHPLNVSTDDRSADSSPADLKGHSGVEKDLEESRTGTDPNSNFEVVGKSEEVVTENQSELPEETHTLVDHSSNFDGSNDNNLSATRDTGREEMDEKNVLDASRGLSNMEKHVETDEVQNPDVIPVVHTSGSGLEIELENLLANSNPPAQDEAECDGSGVRQTEHTGTRIAEKDEKRGIQPSENTEQMDIVSCEENEKESGNETCKSSEALSQHPPAATEIDSEAEMNRKDDFEIADETHHSLVPEMDLGNRHVDASPNSGSAQNNGADNADVDPNASCDANDTNVQESVPNINRPVGSLSGDSANTADCQGSFERGPMETISDEQNGGSLGSDNDQVCSDAHGGTNDRRPVQDLQTSSEFLETASNIGPSDSEHNLEEQSANDPPLPSENPCDNTENLEELPDNVDDHMNSSETMFIGGSPHLGSSPSRDAGIPLVGTEDKESSSDGAKDSCMKPKETGDVESSSLSEILEANDRSDVEPNVCEAQESSTHPTSGAEPTDGVDSDDADMIDGEEGRITECDPPQSGDVDMESAKENHDDGVDASPADSPSTDKDDDESHPFTTIAPQVSTCGGPTQVRESFTVHTEQVTGFGHDAQKLPDADTDTNEDSRLDEPVQVQIFENQQSGTDLNDDSERGEHTLETADDATKCDVQDSRDYVENSQVNKEDRIDDWRRLNSAEELVRVSEEANDHDTTMADVPEDSARPEQLSDKNDGDAERGNAQENVENIGEDADENDVEDNSVADERIENEDNINDREDDAVIEENERVAVGDETTYVDGIDDGGGDEVDEDADEDSDDEGGDEGDPPDVCEEVNEEEDEELADEVDEELDGEAAEGADEELGDHADEQSIERGIRVGGETECETEGEIVEESESAAAPSDIEDRSNLTPSTPQCDEPVVVNGESSGDDEFGEEQDEIVDDSEKSLLTTATELNRLTVKDLRSMLKKEHLPVGGVKPDLIARLLLHRGGSGAEVDDVVSVLPTPKGKTPRKADLTSEADSTKHSVRRSTRVSRRLHLEDHMQSPESNEIEEDLGASQKDGDSINADKPVDASDSEMTEAQEPCAVSESDENVKSGSETMDDGESGDDMDSNLKMYSQKTVRELKELLSEMGVEIKSKAKKADLVQAVIDNLPEDESEGEDETGGQDSSPAALSPDTTSRGPTTVRELREKLKDMGLCQAGTKAVLQKRIDDALSDNTRRTRRSVAADNTICSSCRTGDDCEASAT